MSIFVVVLTLKVQSDENKGGGKVVLIIGLL
jgi:hypothetical protein